MEIKVFRTLDNFYHKMNDDIFREMKIEPVNAKIIRYKSNWLQHIIRLNNRMLKILLNYRPKGRRRLRSPLNKLLDEAETGLLRPAHDGRWWWRFKGCYGHFGWAATCGSSSVHFTVRGTWIIEVMCSENNRFHWHISEYLWQNKRILKPNCY